MNSTHFACLLFNLPVLSDVSRTHDPNGLRTLLATSNAIMSQVLLPMHRVLCRKWDSSRSLDLTSHWNIRRSPILHQNSNSHNSHMIQERSNSDFDVKCATIQFYGNNHNSQSDCWWCAVNDSKIGNNESDENGWRMGLVVLSFFWCLGWIIVISR